MEKTRINLAVLLPSLPDEGNARVQRMIQSLEGKRGIEKVHLVPGTDQQAPQLCFHYDPAQVSMRAIEGLAKKTGNDITEQYGHLLLEVDGIRQPRHARILETTLQEKKGILSASVSAANLVRLEFEKNATSPQAITREVESLGLVIKKTLSAEEGIHPASGGETGPAHADEHDDHQHPPGGERTELLFAAACGLLLALGFGLSFVASLPAWVPISLYIGAYFFGGFFTTKEAIHGISKGHFEIDFLMLVAAIGAAILGEWAEGALLLFLFSLGHSLEHYAMAKAKKSIEALAGLAPKTALRKRGQDLEEVSIDNLQVGDLIVVRPHSKIAADGFVTAGQSSVNQAPITGESIPVDKAPVENTSLSPEQAAKLPESHRVFAGSINGGGTLEISVTRLAADSTIARLVKLVNEAQTQKSPTQNFTQRIEKYYVPAVLILVFLLLFAFLVIDEPFSASFYRAMAVLVAASPCALAISTPSAVLSGVARAARGGVLVKGGKPLEELGTLNAIAFDKTGTLTEGKPRLTGVYPVSGLTEESLLQTVIAVEKLSDHPLAAAIVKDGLEKLGREVLPAASAEAIQGRGLLALYNGTEVLVGNKELFTERGGALPADLQQQATTLESGGHTTMLVQQDGRFLGLITLMDTARPEAKETLQKLQGMGIREMIMLTGDNQKVAEAIAAGMGITKAVGNLLPEQKVAAIEKFTANGKKVAMVGDGVNDAPAMAKSTVGIAMGAAGSDVALETADIALMADRLDNLPFAIGLSKKAHRIIRQNLVISLGMVALLVPLTLLGIAKMGPAVVGHEGSTVVVVFNALRLLAYKQK
ncbi:heavy metal translocating P-type ATPase [Flavisolibacter sp. BT320]|nr:heavy metal translocating P-type ATPase [Flavisolibacter longurius]